MGTENLLGLLLQDKEFNLASHVQIYHTFSTLTSQKFCGGYLETSLSS